MRLGERGANGLAISRQAWLWMAMGALIFGGCERAPTPEPLPVAESATADSPAVQAVSAGPAPVLESLPADGKNHFAEPRETWQVHYIGDAKVGFGRMRVSQTDEGLLLIESEEQITIDRGGSTVTQKVELTNVEEPDGRLVRFESRVNLGPVTTVSRGETTDRGLLRIETEVQGKTVAGEIPWQEKWGGFFAADRSLLNAPMRPGETRTLHALQPLVNQVGEIRLTARDYEEIELLVGSQRLLRIDVTMAVAGVPIDVVMWSDQRGETWKTYLPNLQQTSYRATKELALTKNDVARYDLFDQITVPVNAPLKNGHKTQRVVYRARLKNGDPAEAFVSDVAQTVRSLDPHTAEITVVAIRPGEPLPSATEVQPPTENDRVANSLIQSDDPHVGRMAAGVAPEETDPARLALALEQFVYKAINKKNFSQAFATAAEVAQTREGDCTEHAVLLAALCRARAIPARCAMGLVYFPQPQGATFAYHMWTEAWIEDRWVPLDATLGQGGIGGGHLKVAHSDLHGAGPFAAFLPVFRVLGQLELEVIEQE